ncbi:recombination mediator RecR [Paracrocinitomix mangrovi]|uniref:recombination mediator RecR n=1 Tax=Paracrocinitomix mangrovi TaxID=2862509 RepID=UPI001C8D0D25|nr:recombination mediator RecR [Paracrocinitomix mangrovi]UKN02054.1 recombination mediator RecR [Paracrocinitomix mangrovi]
MNISSKHLEDLVEHFASLPGIGKKTALRLVLNLIKRDEEELAQFATSLGEIKAKVSSCKTCGNISDADLCSICIQPNRKGEIICVVEDIRDILAIESTQQYYGVYHVLGGVISPMEGVGPNDLNIEQLVNRVESGEVEEVVLALNASMEGDTTNFYLYRKLADYNVKITTLSRGVAVGTELQYTDELTLGRSILNRMPFDLNLVRK